jgi:hypothetical protein
MTDSEDWNEVIEVGQIWTPRGAYYGQDYYLVVNVDPKYVYCDVWIDFRIVTNFRSPREELLEYYSVLDEEQAFEINLRCFS